MRKLKIRVLWSRFEVEVEVDCRCYVFIGSSLFGQLYPAPNDGWPAMQIAIRAGDFSPEASVKRAIFCLFASLPSFRPASLGSTCMSTSVVFVFYIVLCLFMTAGARFW